MKPRSTSTLRKWIIPALVLVGALGIARATDPPTPRPVASDDAKQADAKADAKKAKHAPIATLRDRMLQSYHGKTTDIFTSIPGFGDERMVPLYKYVPFQVPDLSTNEVEVEKEITPPQLLKDVFADSLHGFREPGKPLPARKAGGFDPVKGRYVGFGRANSGGPGPRGAGGGEAIRHGLQLRLLDLIGLIDPDGPRAYSGGKAFEMVRVPFEKAQPLAGKNGNVFLNEKAPTRPDNLGKAETAKLETRPLDIFESTGVAELTDGKDLFIRTRGNVIRMLGALRATEQCLDCHTDRKKGDLLGAFSYTFVDTQNGLAKELNGKSAD